MSRNLTLAIFQVTNDDGPPDAVASPYIQAFVETLIEAGHSLTIVVPDQQRSWIGKAHFAHEATTAKAVSLPFYNHKTEKIESHEWILCSGTPATCAQIGLGYYHPEGPEGPKGFGMGFDLVISGPNYGRNCTAALATSSGTIGGAMEAAMVRAFHTWVVRVQQGHCPIPDLLPCILHSWPKT